MVKYPFGLLAAAAVAVGLAGCSSGSSQSAPPPAPVSAPAPMTSAPPPPPPMASHMSRQQRVEALQTALNANGAQVTVDGHMGSKTVAAIRTFQQKQNLKVTGKPDSATLQALGLTG